MAVKARSVIRFTPKRRKMILDVLALRRELEAGTLSESDRRYAEHLLPGICDLVTGKVKSITV